MDDDVRAEHVADFLIRRGECPQHGGPLEDCQDAEKVWFPQRQVCRASMETAAAQHFYDALHKDAPFHDGSFESWSAVRTREHPYHYMDGVTIFAAPVDLNPDDDFLSR